MSKLTNMYNKLKHSIVTIEGNKRKKPETILPFNHPLFFDFHEEHKVSYGSGMIIHHKGYILTCYHVVEGVSIAKVRSSRSRQLYQGKVIWGNKENDLAIIKINASKKLQPVEFDSSSETKIGERVFAIGNPFGFEHTLTLGILSGKQRTVSTDNHEYVDVLQTDTALNPGNSGGPLFNSKGKVIGMNAIIIQSYQNMGFSIPSDTFLPYIKPYIRS